ATASQGSLSQLKCLYALIRSCSVECSLVTKTTSPTITTIPRTNGERSHAHRPLRCFVTRRPWPSCKCSDILDVPVNGKNEPYRGIDRGLCVIRGSIARCLSDST